MSGVVIRQRRKSLGGFEVGRVLPHGTRHMVGPFIFFDHLGPVDFPKGLSRDADVRPHPHIGLSTVTYLFAGEIIHRDSLDNEQAIRPTEVNWMTAGRGITHSERFEQARREGGPMHAIQAWVALPERDEESAPTFAHHAGGDLPLHEEGGVTLRLLAGRAYACASAVRTHSPLFYVHAVLQPGARVELPQQYPERAVYLVSGAVTIAGQQLAATEMIVFDGRGALTLQARSPSTVMLLGGEPLGPRFIDWNFVSSSRERIEQAKADWRAGRMKLPSTDDAEYIPLPPDPAANAGAMS